MFNKKLAACAVATSLIFSGSVLADGYKTFNFKEIESSANSADWNPEKPWNLSEGFKQKVVRGDLGADENDHGIKRFGLEDTGQCIQFMQPADRPETLAYGICRGGLYLQG